MIKTTTTKIFVLANFVPINLNILRKGQQASWSDIQDAINERCDINLFNNEVKAFL